MIDTVGHGVDEVLAEHVGVGTVVLHQMEPGLFTALLIISVQLCPLIFVVGTDVGVDGPYIIHRYRAVIALTGTDRLMDDGVHGVGVICTLGDLFIAYPLVQTSICRDQISYPIKAGICSRTISPELGHPLCQLFQGGIGIAIFIQDPVTLDLKAQMVDTISYRVHQVVIAIPARCSIVLDQVEPGLFTTLLIVSMQGYPLVQVVVPDI